MSETNLNTETIKRIGLTEFKITLTQTYKRRVGTTTWIPLTMPQTTERVSNLLSGSVQKPRYVLHLVRHNQAPDEPLHWSLTISSDEESSSQPTETKTRVLEVRGDTELMYLNFLRVDMTVSSMPDLHSAYELVKLDEENAGVVEEVAGNVEPPKAPSRREVSENCQGWCVRVVQKLVEKEIVESGKVGMMKRMIESIG